MQKGITAVIATILLLLIAIAMIGFAFTFFTRTQSAAQQSGEEALGETLAQIGTSFRIEGIDKTVIYIRNTGSVPLSNLNFYVNNTPVNYTGPVSLEPNAVGTYVLDEAEVMILYSYTIPLRVTGLGAEDKINVGLRPRPTGPIVVIKADDLLNYSYSSPYVSPAWARFIDYMRQEKIAASIGLIGKSLESDNFGYKNYVRELHDDPVIEIWNHGYNHTYCEFQQDYDSQRLALLKTQQLARDIGVNLTTFGAPHNCINDNTTRVLTDTDEITIWLYGNTTWTDGFVFGRFNELESPTHYPNLTYLQGHWNDTRPYYALQVHPNSWDDARWNEFMAEIEFLRSKDVWFLTPFDATNVLT